MERASLRDEIVFKVTGGLLQCELDEKALNTLINSAMREIQRYIDTTRIITIPYQRCIDMTKYKVNSVSRVYRATGFTSDNGQSDTDLVVDPMYASQWQLLTGTGNLYNFSDYAYNYASWNTLLQIRNTSSTDLIFRYDKTDEKLYINIATNFPQKITIEFVPRYDDVSDIKSDFWIDMLTRLCVALAKVALGRIRTRYTQTGAQWTQDGETMLNEGNAELTDIRERLVKATQLNYPVD